MDIAKYIGLFLLKNQFCYVHGLGNMELIKRPAVHDGKELQSPVYEVVLTQGGSIDDNLANFIATNEMISISKAANALRDFSVQSRMDMAAGKEVMIPNMGRFVETKGKIRFVTDEAFRYTPAGIPTIKNSKQLEEQNSRPAHKPSYPPPHRADSINWSMVILAAVLLLIIGGGIYGIYYYTSKSKDNTEATTTTVAQDTVMQAPARPVITDSAQLHKDTTSARVVAPTPVDSLHAGVYKMIIGNYPTRVQAEKREKNLGLNGYKNIDLVPRDSSNFLVVATINCRAVDTTRVIDSLHRLFGYKGVSVFK
jgi:hypothetical protein